MFFRRKRTSPPMYSIEQAFGETLTARFFPCFPKEELVFLPFSYGYLTNYIYLVNPFGVILM